MNCKNAKKAFNRRKTGMPSAMSKKASSRLSSSAALSMCGRKLLSVDSRLKSKPEKRATNTIFRLRVTPFRPTTFNKSSSRKLLINWPSWLREELSSRSLLNRIAFASWTYSSTMSRRCWRCTSSCSPISTHSRLSRPLRIRPTWLGLMRQAKWVCHLTRHWPKLRGLDCRLTSLRTKCCSITNVLTMKCLILQDT